MAVWRVACAPVNLRMRRLWRIFRVNLRMRRPSLSPAERVTHTAGVIYARRAARN